MQKDFKVTAKSFATTQQLKLIHTEERSCNDAAAEFSWAVFPAGLHRFISGELRCR